MKEELNKYLNLFKQGTKKMFKEFFNKETNKKQRANMWTFTRLIIPFITLATSIAGIITSLYPLLIVSGILAGGGAITDALDGASSRKHHSQSEFGKTLDQVSDKFFSFIICLNLLFLNPNYIFLLLGEALIATTNIAYKMKYKNLDISSTKIGRFKQWPLYLSFTLGYFSPLSTIMTLVANISIILSSIIQSATCVSYIVTNNKKIKEMNLNTNIENEEDVNNENIQDKKENLNSKKIKAYKEVKNYLVNSNNLNNNEANEKTNQKKKHI